MFKHISERRICKAIELPRATKRYRLLVKDDEPRLTSRITELGKQYGRYGYRRITALLKREGWRVNHKRVEKIWRREGLKVPKKQPKRRRLWLMTAPVYAFVQRIPTMSGVMILCWIEPGTEGLSGYLP